MCVCGFLSGWRGGGLLPVGEVQPGFLALPAGGGMVSKRSKDVSSAGADSSDLAFKLFVAAHHRASSNPAPYPSPPPPH